MADNESELLREFAGMIQEKAGQDPRSQREPEPAGKLVSLRSALERQPRLVIAGVAAGIGATIGYLVGKLVR